MPDNHFEDLVPSQNLLRFLYHQSMYFVQVYPQCTEKVRSGWRTVQLPETIETNKLIGQSDKILCFIIGPNIDNRRQYYN